MCRSLITRRLLVAGLMTGIVMGAASPARAVPTLQRFREFPIPTAYGRPAWIAAGPDGNLWFTEYSGNKIGRITTGGVITEFPIPTGVSVPTGIASGPDGAMWFSEENGNNIGRMTTTGVITEFPIPTGVSSP